MTQQTEDRHRTRAIAPRILLVGALLGAACGEQAFSAHSRDNNDEDVRRALSLSKAPQQGPQATGQPMAFVITSGSGAERQLAAVDLKAGTVAWKVGSDVRSRLAVGRGIVAHRQGEREIVGRDPATGQPRFTIRLADGERFMGLAVDDERLYYVIQATTTGRRVSYTVGVDRSGHEVWRTPAQGSLGAPGARGGLVALPYAYQNVSLLDGSNGKEVGRVRATDEQINFVRGLPSGLFYGGGRGIYLLDEKSVAGSKKGSSYIEAKLGSDRIRPFYSFNAYDPAQADYSAFDRNRLLWRGLPRDGGVAFEDDLAVLHSYRYLFAFDTKTGKMRWAYAHPRVDVVGAEEVGSAVVFAAADGDLVAVDEKSGRARVIAKTGLKLANATIDADGLKVEAQSGEETESALRATLEQIIWDPDARFTAVKVFAANALVDIPGAETSAALLKIVRAQSGMSRAVQRRAGEVLIVRKDKGAEKLLLEGLAVHSDYLAGRQAMGVDVLARAAAEIGARDAAPLIGAHLSDPETPQTALKELVAALAMLGGKDAARALRGFLLTYRADPLFLQDPAPLVDAGLALSKMGADDKRTVAFVAGERRTLPPVADALTRALRPGAPGPSKTAPGPAGNPTSPTKAKAAAGAAGK